MNDLLQAAKAVIEYWDADATDNLQDEVISKLRAAVERAEKHKKVIGHSEWFESLYHSETHRGCTRLAWEAAQQSLRERIRDLLRESDDWFEDDQKKQAEWLLEKIDE